eukprot:scaffold126_cov246-Pinguiococcus_pyrenoidosus.AAC.8
MRYAASHSTGLGGRSLTSADMPSSKIGTTVWSRYARIGSDYSPQKALRTKEEGQSQSEPHL